MTFRYSFQCVVVAMYTVKFLCTQQHITHNTERRATVSMKLKSNWCCESGHAWTGKLVDESHSMCAYVYVCMCMNMHNYVCVCIANSSTQLETTQCTAPAYNVCITLHYIAVRRWHVFHECHTKHKSTASHSDLSTAVRTEQNMTGRILRNIRYHYLLFRLSVCLCVLTNGAHDARVPYSCRRAANVEAAQVLEEAGSLGRQGEVFAGGTGDGPTDAMSSAALKRQSIGEV